MKIINLKDAINRRLYKRLIIVETPIHRVSCLNRTVLNLYGHQLVAHITKEPLIPQSTIYPRHFGLIFTQERDWQDLLKRAQQQQLLFREETKNRFVDSPLEHRTFFLEDPFYNLMEFKYYSHPEAIFGSYEYTQIGDRA